MREQVQEVKDKTDIVTLISEYVNLKQVGHRWKGLCPFHNEKTPSFIVSPELGIYKCFGCFPAGELIKTPFGLKPIETIKQGEFVQSGKGNMQRVLMVHEREYTGSLVTVNLHKLSAPIRLTSNHEVFVIGGSQMYRQKYKYLSKRLNSYSKLDKLKALEKTLKYFPITKTAAGELQPGMTLLYPIDHHICDIDYLDLSKFITKKWQKHGRKPLSLPLKIKISKDLLKLVGYYIAEGSSHRAYARFSLGSHETKFAREIVILLENIFGLKAQIFERKGHKTGIEVRCDNSLLSNILENLCGKHSENKHIPHEFLHLPLNMQKVLIDAILKGDGYTRTFASSKETFLAINTTSYCLVEQMRDIVLRLGYYPSERYSAKHTDKKGVNHKATATLFWCIDPMRSQYKQIYQDQSGNKFWLLPINKIKRESFSGKVHNLTVEEDHSYVANTFAVANCGESGDVFTFLEKHDGMEFSDALKYLAERAGVVLQTKVSPQSREKETLVEINTLSAQFYHYILTKHPLGKPGLSYIKETRKLTDETIQAFQLGVAPKAPDALFQFLTRKKKFEPRLTERAGVCIKGQRGYIDRFRERVIFPLANHHGEVIALAGRILPEFDTGRVGKYINSPETPTYVKSNSLYGLSVTKGDIKRAGYAVVVEGELDLLSSWQAGVKNVVAIKGSAFTEGQISLLTRYAKTIVLALDSDFAGNNAAIKGLFAAQAAGLTVKVANLGVYKDPDEFAQASPEQFKQAIKSAVDVWDFMIDVTLSKYDVTTGDGTAQVSRELVPLLANISDTIVQEHYVTKLAQKLRVSPDTVMTQVRRQTRPNELKEVRVNKLAPALPRRTTLENKLVGLGFVQNPQFLVTEGITALVRDRMNTKLVNLLQEMLDSGPFELKTFARSLPVELTGHFSEIILQEGEENTSELISLAQELMSIDVRQELSDLSLYISQLEEKNDEEKLSEALSTHARLAKKLAQITNSS